MTSLQGSRQKNDTKVRRVSAKCPYCPSMAATAHPDPLAAPLGEAIYAEVVRHPTAVAQTECQWRTARERSRHKRGPPSSRLA